MRSSFRTTVPPRRIRRSGSIVTTQSACCTAVVVIAARRLLVLELAVDDVGQLLPGNEALHLAEDEVQRLGRVALGVVRGAVRGDDQVRHLPQRRAPGQRLRIEYVEDGADLAALQALRQR